ncbi:hypothetical protein [Dyella solisilvae]|nr:hypothetical protein [Dyella solisilvae]
MAGTSSWNAPVACAGLAAVIGLLIRFPLLWRMTETGEVSLLKALPVVVGALSLLIGSLALLWRRQGWGRLFMVAAIALLAAMFGLTGVLFSVWLWLGMLAALGGAAIGLRSKPAL